MVSQTNLFGLPDYIAQPRNHEGKFSPRCDGEPQKNVKKHLESGLSITVQQCLKLYRTTELRRIISRLRKQGMVIEATWFGNREYYVYKLKKDGN